MSASLVLRGTSLLVLQVNSPQPKFILYTVRVSWGHALERKNVLVTYRYARRVYDRSAACGVIYTVRPEAGCCLVKTRNKWLPRAAGEKPQFLKSIIQSGCRARAWLTEDSLFVRNDYLALKCVIAVFSLLWSPVEEPSLLGAKGTGPPFLKVQVFLSTLYVVMGWLLFSVPSRKVLHLVHGDSSLYQKSWEVGGVGMSPAGKGHLVPIL